MAKAQETTTIDTSNYEYGTTKIRDADGTLRHSRGTGDAVHKAILLHMAGAKDDDARKAKLTQIVKANKLDADKFNPKKFDNQGLLRMSIGNSLRAAVKRGEPVTIGAVEVKRLDQKVDLPKVEQVAPARKPAKKVTKAKKVARKSRTTEPAAA